MVSQKQQSSQPVVAKPSRQPTVAPSKNTHAHAAFEPGTFSNHDILHLQRTVGNRATGRLLTGIVQRALPAAATYKTLDLTDAYLVAVGNAVAAYNQITGQRGNALQFQTCFNRLQAVDRTIYRWFAQVSQNHQRLEGNPHAPVVKQLMVDAEQEHATLVDGSKHLAAVLPFDSTGLVDPELGQLRALWKNIVTNGGKIQLVGSAQYNRRVLAELGKILATPTGRAMLQFLNTPRHGEVPMSPEAALNNIYVGEKLADLPDPVRTASPALRELHHSEAQPLNVNSQDPTRTLTALTEVQESDIDPLHAPDPVQFPGVTAATMSNVRDAAWGGKGGFTHGTKKYDFNDRGTGAFVTSFPGQAVHPGRAPGNEVLTPGWVTLGHELGHAANMRAGATTIDKKAHFDDSLLTGLAGGSAPGKKWDNAEELLNIENVENALRSESGISEREGHQPPVWAQQLAVQTRLQLRAPLLALHQQDHTWYNDAEWFALDRRCRILPVKAALDPLQVQALRDEVNDFMGRKATLLLPSYLLQVSESQAKATVLMQSLPGLPAQIQAFTFLHANTNKFTVIKKALHFGFKRRRGTTKQQRQQSRVTTFGNIISGQQAI